MAERIYLEACAGDLRSASAASRADVDRIELCSALPLGGLTPSIGLVREVAGRVPVPVNVLVRPREGGFVYTRREVDLMVRDIQEIGQTLGAHGVVIGALDRHGDIDLPAMRRMVEAARPYGLHLTFHRAFDVCRDPLGALERVIELGFDTLLTSGQAATALEGAPLIRQLVQQADGRISIMAGAGITPCSAAEVALATGCQWLHASGKGRDGRYDYSPTSRAKIASIRRNLKRIMNDE